jgi:amidase
MVDYALCSGGDENVNMLLHRHTKAVFHSLPKRRPGTPMASSSPLGISLLSSLTLILLLKISPGCLCHSTMGNNFSIKEATVHDLQLAFKQNKLTSRQLVEFYLREISRLNPILKGVIEVNPDALYQADKADYERKAKAPGSQSRLHGIPVLLKDNIATKDKLNTTAGSFALVGSVVPRDAGVVTKLRKAGAIILGKASLGEWSHFRTSRGPLAWSARGGEGKVSLFSRVCSLPCILNINHNLLAEKAFPFG